MLMLAWVKTLIFLSLFSG
ncbi:hypothetical protein MXB_3132 [Myxobolus squamalis]|nr:hypothetical protein MXB_3132 [Myxobolus squamalis]